MQLRHLGYVGQNLTLGLTTGRTVRLANIRSDKLQAAIAANLADLGRILEWNAAKGIGAFRIGSSLIPFASHPEFDLDWEDRFAQELDEIRKFVHRHGMRLSMHPGQYTVLNSTSESVVNNALAELEYHAHVLSLLDPVSGTFTLHVGGAYGDKEAALQRFMDNAARLSSEAMGRMVLENDDRIYGLAEVLDLAESLGRPVVYDHFHFKCLAGPEDPQVADRNLLERVVASWGDSLRPKVHLSSPREPGTTAHADFVEREDLLELMETLRPIGPEREFDLIIEAKKKDQAVLPLLEWLRPQEEAFERDPPEGRPERR